MTKCVNEGDAGHSMRNFYHQQPPARARSGVLDFVPNLKDKESEHANQGGNLEAPPYEECFGKMALMDINLLTSSVVISPVPSLIPLTRENLMFGLW